MPATLTLGGGAFGLHSSGRASVRDKFSVKLCPFNFHGLGGVERIAGVSLLSATVLLVCMPAGREGERAGHSFLLRIRR